MSSATLEQLKQQAAAAEEAVSKAGADVAAGSLWSPNLVIFLTISVLAFGLCVILITAILAVRGNADLYAILRAFGVTTIIIASVFLVVTGYSETQLTPVIGLLGTIAGYLLGSKRDSVPPQTSPTPSSPPIS